MSKTVMIVDDSGAIRTLVGMTLKIAGYTVLEAEHGKDALSKLSSNPVHLVISDVNMPVMGGIEFITELKKLPQYKFTPVIMLTTETEESKRKEGKAAGARAWIVKPFKEEQLLAAVKKLIM